MIPVTVAVPEEKLNFFKELLKSLNLEEIESDDETSTEEISEADKKLVMERIKNSNSEEWIPWDNIKDRFDVD